MPQCFINMQFNCAYSGSRMLWDGHDHRSRFTAASMEISPGAKWTVKPRCKLVPSTPIFSPFRPLVAQKLLYHPSPLMDPVCCWAHVGCGTNTTPKTSWFAHLFTNPIILWCRT